MKKHKHEWDLGDEPCHSCGAYTEYCRVKNCTAVRQHPQDLMSEVVEKLEYEKSIHSQLAGEWTGIKLNGTRTTINPHLEQYEAFTKAQTIIKSK